MDKLAYRNETAATLSHATALIGAGPSDRDAFLAQLGVSLHDTVRLDAAEAGGIRDVRAFTTQLLLSPQFGLVRLGVIEAVEKLTPQAQNALLKVLEEPPARVKLILFLTTEAAVLPTVLSRCRIYRVMGTHTQATRTAYNPNRLEQFVAAEQLAKDEAVLAIAFNWLSEQYNNWCAAGRPLSGLSEMERFWNMYRGLEDGTNKRLLLEQLVISSL